MHDDENRAHTVPVLKSLPDLQPEISLLGPCYQFYLCYIKQFSYAPFLTPAMTVVSGYVYCSQMNVITRNLLLI